MFTALHAQDTDLPATMQTGRFSATNSTPQCPQFLDRNVCPLHHPLFPPHPSCTATQMWYRCFEFRTTGPHTYIRQEWTQIESNLQEGTKEEAQGPHTDGPHPPPTNDPSTQEFCHTVFDRSPTVLYTATPLPNPDTYASRSDSASLAPGFPSAELYSNNNNDHKVYSQPTRRVPQTNGVCTLFVSQPKI